MRRVMIHKTEDGFTVGSLVMLLLLILIIFFAARFVNQARKDNQKQADTINNAVNGGEQINDESDDDYIPPSPQSEAWERPIKRVNIEFDTLTAILIATLPGDYTGSCYAEISLPDGSEPHRFTEALENNDTCRITIPKTTLSAGKTWKFRMSFQTSDGRTYGSHPSSTFTL